MNGNIIGISFNPLFQSPSKKVREPNKYVWRNIIVFLYLHIGTIYGFYLMFSGKAKATTFYYGEQL